MARDPNERVGPGQDLEKPEQFKTLGIAIPEGFVVGTSTGQYYAHYNVHADGHTTVEWYKRGSGGGPGNPDPVALVTPGVTATDVKNEWDKAQTSTKPTNVYVGVNPTTGKPSQISEYPDPSEPGGVRRTYDDTQVPAGTARAGDVDWHTEGRPDGQGGFDNRQPIMVRTVNGVRETREPTGAELKDWNLAGQIQRNPGGKTDAEVTADTAKQVGQPTGNTRQRTEGTTTVKETEVVLPDGTRVWRTQTETAAPTAAQQVGSPTGNTRERDENGAKIKETEYVLPNGTREWRVQTAAGEKAGRKEEEIVNPADHKTYIRVTTTDPATNQIRIFHLDPATRQEVTLPGSAMAGVKGVPSYTPDLTRPGAGLIDRAKQLDELMQAGTITWEQRQEILKGDQTLASTIANEFNAGAAVLRETFNANITQRGQDITNTQHRAALANTHLTNALGMVETFGPYLGATPGDAGKLFRGLIAGQLAQATAYGGMRDVPREQQDPALNVWAQRAVSGAGGPASVTGGPASVTGGPAGVTGGPNALGVGAIGNQPAPGAVPAPPREMTPATGGPPQALPIRNGVPVTSTPAIPGPPTAGEPGGPPLAPGSVWQPPAAGATTDSGFYPPWGQGADTSDSGFYPPWGQGADTTDPGFHRSGMGSPATQGAIARALPNLTADSWRGAAQQQASQFDPNWTPEAADDFGTSVGQPLLALDSAIPGLTPDLDKEARRQLDMALAGGRIGR